MGIPPFFPLCEMTGGPPVPPRSTAHQAAQGRPRVGQWQAGMMIMMVRMMMMMVRMVMMW